LDVLVKDRIRAFLKQINQEEGTTILLTTHDTQDIELVAKRLILIDQGKLLFDGSQQSFRETYQGAEYLMQIEFTQDVPAITHDNFRLQNKERNNHAYLVSYEKMNRGEAISYIVSQHAVEDIKVKELGLEDILKKIYVKS
jgi:ABC-2 type transport system ATP-binding protein